MEISRPTRRSARIEMLPLIDIVFLLLVFFIYAMLSMAVHSGLQLDLPESSQAERSEGQNGSLFVRVVGGELQVFHNNNRVEIADIPAEFSETARGRNGGVLLFAEKQVSYQQLYQVLDQLKRAGVHDVSLQADRE